MIICRVWESGTVAAPTGMMGGTTQPWSRLNRESAAKQKKCQDDAAVPAVTAGLSYLLLKFSRVRLSAVDQSSVTVLFLAAGARIPTCAREKCAGGDHTRGWGPAIYHLRRNRHFSLSSTPFPLPLCKMDADVAGKGDAGWELTLSADCGLRTANGRPGPGYDDGVQRSQLQRTSRGWVRVENTLWYKYGTWDDHGGASSVHPSFFPDSAGQPFLPSSFLTSASSLGLRLTTGGPDVKPPSTCNRREPSRKSRGKFLWTVDPDGVQAMSGTDRRFHLHDPLVRSGLRLSFSFTAEEPYGLQ